MQILIIFFMCILAGKFQKIVCKSKIKISSRTYESESNNLSLLLKIMMNFTVIKLS
jgi:hypothetical protein